MYDSNGDLLWIGTNWVGNTGVLYNPITPTNWEAGTWDVTFLKGAPTQDGTGSLEYSDTSTESVEATVIRANNASDGTITFSYGGHRYMAYLTNYQSSTNTHAQSEQPGYIYYTYAPYSPNDPRTPTATDGVNAIMMSNWTVAKPTVYAETASPGDAIDVSWVASNPVYSGYGTASITGTAIYLDYANNPQMVGAQSSSLSGTSGTVNLTGLTEGRTYYFQIRARWTTSDGAELPHQSDVSSATTITPLNTPEITNVTALDGEGSATWGAVANAVGYEYGVTSDAATQPVTGTSISGTTWSFNDTDLKGKFLFVRAIAESNQIVYKNSGWQSRGVEIPATESGDDPEVEPTTAFLNRRLYKAIPYIDVPVEQIGLGGNIKDAITVEYADNRYLRSDGEGGAIIPTTSLPWAVYGTTSDESTDTVINPAYLKAAIGDLDLAYTITEIAVSDATGAKKFAGVQLGSGESATSTTTISLVSKKYIEDTYVPKTQFATYSGGSSNAGIVWVHATAGNDGLLIDSTDAGRLKVNFATFSAWNSTASATVVNPDYVRAAITSLGLNNSASSYAASQGGYFVKLDADGYIDSSLLPAISLTSVISDTTARTYGTGKTYESRAAAIANVLSTHAANIQEGDMIVVCPASLTDEEREYTLTGTFLCGMSGGNKILVEVNTPNWAVSSVNGKTGTVSLGISDLYASGSTKASIAASIGDYTSTSEDYKLATAKAVFDYAATKSHTHNFATSSTGGFVIVGSSSGLGIVASGNQTPGLPVGSLYIDSVASSKISDRITAAVTSDTPNITASATGVVTGKALYEYVTGYDVPVSQLPIASWSTTSGSESDWNDTGTTIVDLNYLSAALTDLQTELAGSSHNQAITTIYATGTTLFTGTVTDYSTYTASAEDYQVPTAFAVKSYVTGYSVGISQLPTASSISDDSTTVPTTAAVNTALAGKAPSTHSHTSSQISDAISAFTSGANGKGKAVLTQSSGETAGLINADLLPVDELTISASGGLIGVDASWLSNYLDGYGILMVSTARETYLGQSAAGIAKWSSSGEYAVGDVVLNRGELYQAIAASGGSAGAKEPYAFSTGVTAVWKKISLYDLFVEASRYSGTITGDGSTTEFTVTHNLGAKFVQVTLVDSNDQEVYTAIKFASENAVTLGFGNPPASGTVYSVVVRA